MSRSSAQKRIHYVRAVYGQAKPKDTLESVLRSILKHMPHAGDTEIEHPSLGTLSLRFRNTLDNGGLYLAIGQGVRGESMATIGLKVQTENDLDQPVPPNDGRAFKLSDAFCLIDENDVLLCTDGGLRTQAVSYYIRKLLEKGVAPNASQAVDLVARINQDKADVLSSGIKSIKVISTAYEATQIQADKKGDGWLKGGVGGLLEFVRSAFEESIENDAERETLIDNEGDIIVSTEIKVRGGLGGKEVLLRALDEIAMEAAGDIPDGAEMIIMTKEGAVNSNDVVLQRTKSIKRQNGQNGLDHADAWNRLTEYRAELIGSKLWKK